MAATADSAPARPGFVDGLSAAYGTRKKRVVLLHGDTLDIFRTGRSRSYLPLEQLLYQEFRDKVLVVRFDAANGVTFYDPADEKSLLEVCRASDALVTDDAQRLGNVTGMFASNRHNPLPNLRMLTDISSAVTRVRVSEDGRVRFKPLCVVMQYAGSLFPAGDYDRLGELDRQRLVCFLNWVTDPNFVRSTNLVVLVSDTRAEVNSRILAQPCCTVIHVDHPETDERRRFIEAAAAERPGLKLECEAATLAADSAGLALTNLDDVLSGAQGSGEPVTRKGIVAHINEALQSRLAGIIRVVRPDHTSADLLGPPELSEAFAKAFKRCDDPRTAASVILVAGPNGGGKTYRVEAHSADSGRLVIELTGLRDSEFGGSERRAELFREQVETFGRVTVVVDEAHTQLPSVHRSQVHETERRLGGFVLRMMSDKKLLGRVLWVLMTSRPDELDPDIKSRASIQLPIFDLEGEVRRTYVQQFLERKGFPIPPEQFDEVMRLTEPLIARDLNDLAVELLASGRTLMEALKEWRPSSDSIVDERRYQTLVAAQHCTYRTLLPAEFQKKPADELQHEIDTLRLVLRYDR